MYFHDHDLSGPWFTVNTELGSAIAPRPINPGEAMADYLYREALYRGVYVWDLPGLSYLNPNKPGLGRLFENAKRDQRRFLSMLDAAARHGMGNSPHPLVVEMVGVGSGVWDWPDEVKNAWKWAWGVRPFASSRVPSNIPNAGQIYATEAQKIYTASLPASTPPPISGSNPVAAIHVAATNEVSANGTAAMQAQAVALENNTLLQFDKKVVQPVAKAMPTIKNNMLKIGIVAAVVLIAANKLLK